MIAPVPGRPILYDLFSGADGAGKGYQLAGFRVVGVDINPQPHYPCEGFIQMDAFEFIRRVMAGEYPLPDAWHASPPCQVYCTMAHMGKAGWAKRDHPDLVAPVRQVLQATGQPYVIENVPGAPLVDPARICGSAFGLGVRRHRLFESNCRLTGTACYHKQSPPPIAVYGDHPQDASPRIRRACSLEEASVAMGIDWMVWRELTQAIPPAYTEFVGLQLRAVLQQLPLSLVEVGT